MKETWVLMVTVNNKNNDIIPLRWKTGSPRKQNRAFQSALSFGGFVVWDGFNSANYLVVSTNPFEKYAGVKWDHFPPVVGVKFQNIFELPPPSFS